MNNWDLIEKNEASKNANGGTELFLKDLYDGRIPRELLEECQIIPSRIRDLKEDKIRILTMHDLPGDPESAKLKDASFRKKFHKIVFISEWQYQQYMAKSGLPYSKDYIVIENGLKPVDVDIEKKIEKTEERLNLFYGSTPQRGLQILYPVFEKLAAEYPHIHLHVHSSFKIYGWDEPDQFKNLYDVCEKHPRITFYGFTPYEELKKKMADYHILAYPCIWEETACRTLIESMSAGMMCIHPNFSALPDTCGHLSFMYAGDVDPNQHANIFYSQLKSGIKLWKEDKKELIEFLSYVKNYADFRFSVNRATNSWITLLTDLNKKYSTVESRASFSGQQFVYRTT